VDGQREVKVYRSAKGREPFTNWLNSIRDARTIARILRRLDRVEAGSFGDFSPVGDGVYELRFFFGAGYRVYFAFVGATVVLLLCGGDKSGQAKDISRAKEYWRRYQETANE
jgi:putative addiction module killer protein